MGIKRFINLYASQPRNDAAAHAFFDDPRLSTIGKALFQSEAPLSYTTTRDLIG